MGYIGTWICPYKCFDTSTQNIWLGERISRGALPTGILKLEKYCPGLDLRLPNNVKNITMLPTVWIRQQWIDTWMTKMTSLKSLNLL